MSNDLKGLKSDIVYIDEAADFDYTVVSLWQEIGWISIDPAINLKPLPPCVLCKEIIHPIDVDHPFFYNNLEYLEHEAAKKGL